MPKFFFPLFVAAFVTLVLVLGSALQPPRPEEPLLARWGRTAAVHPFRTGLAVALLAVGLRGFKRRQNGRDLPNLPPAAREREPFGLG